MIQFLDRLHPLIVHLPIGFLIMTLAIHGLVWEKPDSTFCGLLPGLWLASCLSAILSCGAGYLLSLSGDYPGLALHTLMNRAYSACQAVGSSAKRIIRQ